MAPQVGVRGHYGPTPGLRGVCPACGDEWGLRHDGTMRYHGQHVAGSWWCEGSGQPAKIVTFIPCVRPSCGHEAISEHSADADGEPCMVDGCRCQGAVYGGEGFLASLEGMGRGRQGEAP